MQKVSVIIPVHNAEKYLDECLDSLLAMTGASAAEFDEASPTNGKGRGYAR